MVGWLLFFVVAVALAASAHRAVAASAIASALALCLSHNPPHDERQCRYKN